MNHDSWRTKLDKIGILLILDIDLLTGMGWKVSDRLVRFRRAWKLQIEKHQMKSWTCNCNWVSYSPEMWHDACFQMMLRCNDTRINWLIFRKLQRCWHGNHWPIKIDCWNTSIIRQRFFVNLMLSPKPFISLDTPWLSRHVGIAAFHRHEESAGGRGTWQIRFS